jgi:hypothetical protein
MTSRDFCYWLQGFFELQRGGLGAAYGLEMEQVDCIRKHLQLVFKHEIDPSAGPPAHQTVLDAIHGGPKLDESHGPGTTTLPHYINPKARC